MRYLLQDTIIYGIADVLLRAISIITLPLYARLFTPADYGTLSYILTISAIFSTVVECGLSSAYAFYYFQASDERNRETITFTSLSFIFVFPLILVIISWPSFGYISSWSFSDEKYQFMIGLALVNVPFTLAINLCAQILRNQFRPWHFAALALISGLTVITTTIVLVVILGWGILGNIAGVFIGNILILPVYLWVIRHSYRPIFSLDLLRNLLKYGLPLIPMSVAYWVFVASDRIILVKLSTLTELGWYAMASNLIVILNMANSAFGQAWSPRALLQYKNYPDKVSTFYGQGLIYLLLGFSILSVTLSAYVHEILRLLTTPEYYSAEHAVPPLALGFIALASSQITASAISLSHKTIYFALYSWIAALLNLGLNYIFVPYGGMVAASWTTAIAYLFITVAYYFTSQKLMPHLVSYDFKRISIILGLTILFTLATAWLPHIDHFIVAILLKTGYCVIYLMLLLVFRALDYRVLLKGIYLLQSKMLVYTKNDIK